MTSGNESATGHELVKPIDLASFAAIAAESIDMDALTDAAGGDPEHFANYSAAAHFLQLSEEAKESSGQAAVTAATNFFIENWQAIGAAADAAGRLQAKTEANTTDQYRR